MNLEELKIRIGRLHLESKSYRALIEGKSDNPDWDSLLNNPEFVENRSSLNMQVGRLGEFLRRFGSCPSVQKPNFIREDPLVAYLLAFSEEDVGYVLMALGTVIQDLNVISGKLRDLSQDQFEQVMNSSKPIEEGNIGEEPHTPSIESIRQSVNWLQRTSPQWWIWRFLKWSWRNKIIRYGSSGIFVLITLDYTVAGNNLKLFWNWLSGLVFGP